MGAQAGSGPCKLLVTNLNVQLGVRSSALFSQKLCCLGLPLMSQPAIKMPDAPSCVGVGGIHVTPLTPLHFSLPGMRTCSCIIVAKHCLCVSAQSVLGQVLSQAYIVHAVNAV